MATLSRTLPDLSKLEPLDGTNFKRWSQKLLIFFEQLDVDYVLFTNLPENPQLTSDTTTAIVSATQTETNRTNDDQKVKYERDNKTVRGHLLNHMSNTLFDLFVNQKSAKEIWETLETRYGGDDAGRKKYVVGKWLQFHMTDDKPIMDQVHEYENLVADVLSEGSVMFLMNYTRPDIAYAVSRLSRYTHNPNKDHWDALRRLLRYLKGTMNLCLHFNKYPAVLEGFCDANWVTDNDEVSSTSGYVFTLGGGAISWKSAKQTCIARSTMESEFIALELAGQEAEWLRNLVGDVPLWGSSVPVSLHCDSQAAIGIAKNYAYNGKRRHIRIRHGAVKELLKGGIISLEYVRSERNLADPLTKGLTRRIILETSRAMGLKPLE
ncbi:UNVERIFIED_CONTAM: Retrovirus-related Pol polyprotein from transposon TNT 1-94 [Sesamum radiatum]|uniref:Retrovirus-related Pol polyprotein from transposon TNT 1-94 n=1 Tax=Sesamum radiatum TaxID=300843 RepID=A0AAW2WNI0_SESRA